MSYYPTAHQTPGLAPQDHPKINSSPSWVQTSCKKWFGSCFPGNSWLLEQNSTLLARPLAEPGF